MFPLVFSFLKYQLVILDEFVVECVRIIRAKRKGAEDPNPLSSVLNETNFAVNRARPQNDINNHE